MRPYINTNGHKRCRRQPIRIKVSKFDKKAETLKRSMSMFAPDYAGNAQIYKEFQNKYKNRLNYYSVNAWVSRHSRNQIDHR